ncbi:conserved hypothetical protein [Desulfamplus magnetovallimortis]|uniref:Alpha/beta hydrolase n=1 Tax=Desulfamplus magnetovallimortis TaxID=1246637 RepID=A0A1W1H4W3_9BACT|nr:hypothetical protein [Desulfamplus magnetovallimortis]SLM27511.1 conserved hypothetical protein [Desulfamplus magnetovallimortis]
MTEKIIIELNDIRLEGVFKTSDSNFGAIITHPHPEYGGNMHNSVVMAIEQAYQSKGYATLRFNFRGTGGSTGNYDTFNDLCNDVIAAYDFIKGRGFADIALAGYSFGSWVNAHTETILNGLIHQLLVSPPVSFMDFTKINGFSCDSFVICGDKDEYAKLPDIKNHIEKWQTEHFEIIKGCDHFYSGMIGQLNSIIDQLLQ